MKGDVVNWDKANFDLENMIIHNLPQNSICQPLRLGHVFFPHGDTFSAADEMCQKLRAKMTVVHDRETQTMLHKVYKNSPFIGLSKREETIC